MTKVLIIVTAIVVVAAIGVGAYYISGQQRRAYDEGHAAYLGGDCVKATGPLEDAADSDMDEKLADKARAELDECQALLAADALDTQGRQSAAVLSYSKFVVTYPASPIVDVAVSKGQALLSKSPPERLGDLELCNALDALDAQGFVAAPDDVLPPLLLACGEAYANAGDYVAAIAVLDRIRSDYPGHPLMADVEDAYVRITLAEADATGPAHCRHRAWRDRPAAAMVQPSW